MILAKYYVWLVGASLFMFGLERLFTWRKNQKVLRPGIGQDLFWLVFSGHFLGLALATGTGYLVHALNAACRDAGLPVPESLRLMQDLNHANIRTHWGPLRYVFNSPTMHVWHHDGELHGKGGQKLRDRPQRVGLDLWHRVLAPERG